MSGNANVILNKPASGRARLARRSLANSTAVATTSTTSQRSTVSQKDGPNDGMTASTAAPAAHEQRIGTTNTRNRTDRAAQGRPSQRWLRSLTVHHPILVRLRGLIGGPWP